MISDKVWSAMDQQVRDEAKRKSAAKATIRPKRGSDLPPTSRAKPRLVKSVKLSCYQSNHYRLRHTHHFESLRSEVDIHTLGKKMGNLTAMIEPHHLKLMATMPAEQLA